MKKLLFCSILSLTAIYCVISYAVTARQLYKVVYDSTRDCNYWYYVDRICVGNSTTTYQNVVIFGTGTIKIGQVYISTAPDGGLTFSNDRINGVDISDLQFSTAALLTLFNQHITSNTVKFEDIRVSTESLESQKAVREEVRNSTNTLYANHITTATEVESAITSINTNLSQWTTGWTDPIVFDSSDNATGVLIEKNTVWFSLPIDFEFVTCKITSLVSGTFSIQVDTMATLAGTASKRSTFSLVGTDYASSLDDWIGSTIIPAGTIIKIMVIDALATTQRAVVQFFGKRSKY